MVAWRYDAVKGANHANRRQKPQRVTVAQLA
jgi:hypothetical protein